MTPREQREAIRRDLELSRKAAGKSYARLAEETGIHRQLIANLERGQGCNESTLLHLANHLGFEVRLIRKEST